LNKQATLLLLFSIVVFYALAGGGIGWWVGTRAIYRRSSHTLNEVDIRPDTLARRKRWRLVQTAAGATVGTLAGLGFLVFLARAR
jgi:hypothetical protein